MKLNVLAKFVCLSAGASLLSFNALASDNRSFAMGGAGVANGTYNQAATLNPALVSTYEERDNFGLIIPSVYAEVADEGEMFDAVDDFQVAYDRLEALLNQAEQGDISPAELEQARLDVADRFGEISGDLSARVGGQLALSIPNRFASAQFFVNSDLEAFGATRLDDNDIERILNATNVDALNDLTSEGYVVGRLVTDLGVAIGKRFTIGGRDIHVGIAPKIQEVESFTYFSALSNLDEDNFDADEFRSSSSQLNLDLGLSMPLTQRLSAGVSVSNLLSNEVDGQPIFSRRLNDTVSLDYEIKPHAVAGLGYNTRRMSLSLDLDLTSQNYLGLTDESQRVIFGDVHETQFVRAGYEYDVGRWVQFRLGYRHDLEGTYDDAITAGVGFSPFGRVHINVSGMYIDERSLGGGVQLMFTF
ncbi:conjugal transfer protein TraF [Aliidiomarina sp. Khilg15.8]